MPSRVTLSRRVETNSSQTHPLLSEDVKFLEIAEKRSWVPEGPEKKADFAGEDQQQFTLPDK
jgi:hypothetical protein